jgi:hypothetical protein
MCKHEDSDMLDQASCTQNADIVVFTKWHGNIAPAGIFFLVYDFKMTLFPLF